MNYNEYSYKKRNLKFIDNLIKKIIDSCKIKKTSKILSIGSGDYIHEKFLELYGCSVTCLNDKNIYNAEVDNLHFIEDTFDFVFIKSVIEHISNTDLFLSEIYRVLKPNGKVIILTPDYQKQKDFFYDDYTHVKPFTLSSLKMALLLNNFKIEYAKHFYYYRAIWENKMIPNFLPCRIGYWLTEKTGIKYFRWGSDRQLFVIGIKV